MTQRDFLLVQPRGRVDGVREKLKRVKDIQKRKLYFETRSPLRIRLRYTQLTQQNVLRNQRTPYFSPSASKLSPRKLRSIYTQQVNP